MQFAYLSKDHLPQQFNDGFVYSPQTPKYEAYEIAVFNPDKDEWKRKKVEVINVLKF